MAQTPSTTRCDVLVIGGGSAGVAASVAAARAGAATWLIERHGALGGMASVALVHSVCGLYLLGETDAPGAVYANAGLPVEFARRLIASGGAWGPRRMGRVDVLLQHPTAFAGLCDRMVGECPTLIPRLHTEMTAVHGGGGRVWAVETRCRGRSRTIEPAVVVDATGDAEVAHALGAAQGPDPAGKLQRPAFIFSLLGVDPESLDRDGRVRLAAGLARAVRGGDLPEAALGAAFHATGRGGEAFVTLDLDPPHARRYDPTDPACLTALEMHGRSLARTLARFLQDHAPGFDRAHIASLPGRVGVRESRQVRAITTLTAEHLRTGAAFDDAVARATWPMEMRETARGPRLRFPENGRPCDIPLRALRVAGVDNLYAAGRCIGCDHGAQGSIRVIGTCLATGQAAGLAAALLAGRGSGATHSDIDAGEVRRESLKSEG